MTPFSEYINVFLIFLPLVFALQLLTYKNAYSKPNRILGVYMIILSFYYLLNKIILLDIEFLITINALLVLPIFLAFNPFYYLYVQSLTNESFSFKPKHILHYLPSFILFLFLLILSFMSRNQEFQSQTELLFKLRVPVAVSIYYIQVITYIIGMIILLNKHKKNLDQFFSYKENISLNWLWLFIIIYILFTTFDAAVYFTHIFDAYYKLTYWVLMTLFVVFLGYFGTKQADIYVGKIKILNKGDDDAPDTIIETNLLNDVAPEAVEDDKSLKYGRSSLANEQKEMILQSIVELMEKEKLFCNPHLVVDHLAERIHTNKKYISQVINEKLGKNFYQFVNEYRVQHVISMLEDEKFNNYTLEAIGDMAGFNSRSSLISSFKKITGKTPSDYKKFH